MTASKILIVEDDDHMRAALEATLRSDGYAVELAKDVRDARAKITQGEYLLVLTDLKMPDGTGMDVLREVHGTDPSVPVIVITAYGTVEGAVEAMKEGAVDFIQKPFSLEALRETIQRCLGPGSSSSDESIGGEDDEIVTQDPRMKEILQRARVVASSKVPVLIQGESGTGKELLARFIHRHSPRKDRPLVAINCAAIPENLLESELFGHEKGAFTGAHCRKIGKIEQAHKGTLLLDEIGEMNQLLQAKLLRVLQEWVVDRVGGREPVPVDVRLIATTNADLARCVREGSFREDLYFRLNVIPFTLPPLRERPEDIPLLAMRFLKRSARAHGKAVTGLTPRAMEALKGHPWKGNVRELKNAVERAVLLAQGPRIDTGDLWLEGWEMPSATKGILMGSVKEVERELILQTLQREGWNRTRASKKLGISIRTLRNKLQEYRREGFLPAGML
jgi:two-component system response regulator FlrC